MNLLSLPPGQFVLGDGPFLLANEMPPEVLCLDREEDVQGIHRAFLAVGSQLIGTNSLAANAPALEAAGLEGHTNEINWKASQLAKSALQGQNGQAAGRVGPLPVQADWQKFFQEQIGALLDGGVRTLLFQEFHHLGELLTALEVKHSLHHCPAICLCSTDTNGRMAGGESLKEAWRQLEDADAEIIGWEVDWNGLPEKLPAFSEPCLAVSLRAVNSEGKVATAKEFAASAARLLDAGARILLGGKGARPEHIRAVAQFM